MKGFPPGEVAIFRLPSPLGVESIRPAILRASKTLVQEGAIRGMVEGVAVIPDPVAIKEIAVMMNMFRRR